MSESEEYINGEKEMNFGGHLTELRNRLIVTAIVFVLFFIVGFLNVKSIYSFFVDDIDMQLTVISPAEIIWIYFSIAGLIAFAGSIPVIVYQLWAFVSPALTPKEKRVSLAYIPGSLILFVLGLVFGYMVFVNLIFPFLLSLNDDMFNVMFTVERYFGFLLRVTLPFAFLFELPIFTMFLTSLGVLTPAFMVKNRKYAYFILIVIGVLITPPDFILQIVVAIPLIIIYEISIQLCKAVYRKKQAQHEAFMNE
ncbi:twin-arginine translocase subunit TatC [Oceanobacillus sp. J11TS1]|uniref:twin-arginine translocase subunit TatC n=1 Tax=Oceanobacillus sp. J11TS1 TaxID=2807191 RepID=UPI001B0D69C4|nr:twin-arginine translocase subunit TatC [Oceanobacillus sp. J11TS1]GIO22666.1 Sec-independent protein translocase protein TatCd [Oceanobacillus sp. J11TS1]